MMSTYRVIAKYSSSDATIIVGDNSNYSWAGRFLCPRGVPLRPKPDTERRILFLGTRSCKGSLGMLHPPKRAGGRGFPGAHVIL